MKTWDYTWSKVNGAHFKSFLVHTPRFIQHYILRPQNYVKRLFLFISVFTVISCSNIKGWGFFFEKSWPATAVCCNSKIKQAKHFFQFSTSILAGNNPRLPIHWDGWVLSQLLNLMAQQRLEYTYDILSTAYVYQMIIFFASLADQSKKDSKPSPSIPQIASFVTNLPPHSLPKVKPPLRSPLFCHLSTESLPLVASYSHSEASLDLISPGQTPAISSLHPPICSNYRPDSPTPFGALPPSLLYHPLLQPGSDATCLPSPSVFRFSCLLRFAWSPAAETGAARCFWRGPYQGNLLGGTFQEASVKGLHFCLHVGRHLLLLPPLPPPSPSKWHPEPALASPSIRRTRFRLALHLNSVPTQTPSSLGNHPSVASLPEGNPF